MSLNESAINDLLKLISVHVDQVTCTECCKYYIVPTTAACGHSLCRGCWYGRRTCPECGLPVHSKALSFNLPLQNKTENVHMLVEKYEETFHIKLDELLIDTPIEKQSAKDPTKHVKDWLASSENQFTATQASQQSLKDLNNQPCKIVSKIQIHSETSKAPPIANKLLVKIPQDDWDKIEEMPNTEEAVHEKTKNAIGPMDIEPLIVNESEFTTENPRRSLRKRDYQESNTDISGDKTSSKYSSDTNLKTGKSEQIWGNVKRMKKEFSKLNKQNKSKLNVSIEMIKKKEVEKKITSNNNEPITKINCVEGNAPNIENNPKPSSSITNILSDQPSCESHNEERIDSPKAANEIQVKKNSGQALNNSLKHTPQNISCPENLFSPLDSSNSKSNQRAPVAFIMKGALQIAPTDETSNKKNNLQSITVDSDNIDGNSSDNIEITIKIGNTLTNICIQKKEKDVQVKINNNKEIQTSLDYCKSTNKKNASCSPIKEIVCNNEDNNKKNSEKISPQPVEECQKTSQNFEKDVNSTHKTLSTKKNTESADTVAVQYEITESIEKELSKEMEHPIEPNTQCTLMSKKKNDLLKPLSSATVLHKVLDNNYVNDLDLFDNDSVKERNVQMLKDSNYTSSEILVSTMKSNKSKKHTDKRTRQGTSDDLPVSKKLKMIQEDNNIHDSANTDSILKSNQTKNFDKDSALISYDVIMDQVFANIDADMEDLEKNNDIQNSEFEKTKNTNAKEIEILSDSIHGFSENVFSIQEKENEKNHTDNLKSPSVAIDKQQNVPTSEDINNEELIELCTPVQNNDEGDDSIVEETPQKSISFLAGKQKSDINSRLENTVTNKSLRLKSSNTNVPDERTSTLAHVVNISDITAETSRNSKHVTVIEANPKKTLETPLTITKFVDELKHKSTPLARKSLNFDKENSEAEFDNTLCTNSFLVPKTTQEREFMSKAFEDSPNMRAQSPLMTRNIKMRNTKFCLAGSCLTPSEVASVKSLCSLRGWDYVDKYTNDLTHLVIGVDDENRSQRSVKYMCALAAGKWIVSYEWVKKCLLLSKVVDEEPFEVLDSTGEPGPRRSRITKQKLFKGITFFCMPPFSILDVETLKEMLEAAGGKVVGEAKAIRVTSTSPALLLAEPEHTQEDRFIYLAMDLGIVPVNYEWVLSCLGSYTIGSIHELLLCPHNLLPPLTAQWPPALIARDED